MIVGLRFPPLEQFKLQRLADRCKSEGLMPESITLFQSAADATRSGQPLRVTCSDLEEARVLADGFPVYGIARPTLEQMR